MGGKRIIKIYMPYDLVEKMDSIARGRGGRWTRGRVICDLLEQRRIELAQGTGLITDQEIIDTLEALRARIEDRATELALRRHADEQE